MPACDDGSLAKAVVCEECKLGAATANKLSQCRPGFIGRSVHERDVEAPNDLKLSDGGGLAQRLGAKAAGAAAMTARSSSLQRMVRRCLYFAGVPEGVTNRAVRTMYALSFGPSPTATVSSLPSLTAPLKNVSCVAKLTAPRG